MISVLMEKDFYYIGNYVDYGFNEDGPSGIKTDYAISEILEITTDVYNSKLERDFNATWDNPYNHTTFGFYKFLIGFKNISDAQKALEWVQSLIILNKLGKCNV